MDILKITLLFLLLSAGLFSSEYYARVEPYEIKKISSNVVGVVLDVKEEFLGKSLNQEPFIIIDASLDRDELEALESKLINLEQIIKADEKILANLKESLKRKRENYKRIKEMKIKSSVEKDREFYNMVASENSFLATQKEVDTLKNQMMDLQFRKAQLRRSISDKSIASQGFMLYSIDVKEGQVVNRSTPLATVVDTSKALLTIYLDREDVKDASNATVYINGKKTEYKLDRVIKMADSKNISKYKAQIVIKAPKIFSELVKVELK